MVTPARIHVGDYGHVIKLDTEVDLSFASSVSMRITKPDGSVLTKSASVADTTKVQYTVESGVFDQQGTYLFHAQAAAGAGLWTGSPHEERVWPLDAGD